MMGDPFLAADCLWMDFSRIDRPRVTWFDLTQSKSENIGSFPTEFDPQSGLEGIFTTVDLISTRKDIYYCILHSITNDFVHYTNIPYIAF